MCIYIYIYMISPPLSKKTPLIRNPPPWGEKQFVTINLDGGTITPLIRNDVWFDLPPSKDNPPNKKPPLGGEKYCYYQFRRRHDYPPRKKTMFGQTSPQY